MERIAPEGNYASNWVAHLLLDFCLAMLSVLWSAATFIYNWNLSSTGTTGINDNGGCFPFMNSNYTKSRINLNIKDLYKPSNDWVTNQVTLSF